MGLLPLFLFFSIAFGGILTDISAQIDGHAGWQISRYLSSMSLVYAWAPDMVYGNSTYQNTTVAEWARSHGLASARYPAGMASYYNWEDPSGTMGKSTFDPEFTDKDRAPEHEWMSFEEYLNFCETAALQPLIGVNYNCHNQDWAPSVNESVARAVRQVRHALSRGFTGAFWYIGNEDSVTQEENMERWALHSRAMKTADPTMKVFFNFNGLQPASLRSFLLGVGRELVDGAEFHGKWPYGGNPDLPPATYQEWLQEVPLLERKTMQTWREKPAALRLAAAEVGHFDLLLANNEFGLGNPNRLVGFNRFTKSLVVTELSLEMYKGGYDVAAFWDNHDGGHSGHSDHMLMATNEGPYRFNPSSIGLQMLANAGGHTMLNVTTDESRVHGFAARSEDGKKPYLQVFLINKLTEECVVSLKLPAGSAMLVEGEVMVDTADHWGAQQPLDVECNTESHLCTFQLPAVSFARITSLTQT